MEFETHNSLFQGGDTKITLKYNIKQYECMFTDCFYPPFYAFKLLYSTYINMTVNLHKCQEMPQTETRGT